MTNDKTILITPNITECLKILKNAMNDVKDPGLKKLAEEALAYLEKTAAGEPQPETEKRCRPGILFMQN